MSRSSHSRLLFSRSIASLFPNAKREGRVHFRVEVTTPPPVQPATPTTMTSWTTIVSPSPTYPALALPKERFPSSLFAEHRQQLNAALAKKEAALKTLDEREAETPSAFVAVLSNEGTKRLSTILQEDKAAFPVKELGDNFIEKRTTMLQDERKAFGSAKRTTAVRRLQQSVATIFGAAATLSNEKLSTEMEPVLGNDLVFTKGSPDLLVTRKQRKMVVNVSLHEDQLQAQAETLVLMDVVQAAPVFGVVSTFSDWIFYKYDETGAFLTTSWITNRQPILHMIWFPLSDANELSPKSSVVPRSLCSNRFSSAGK
ncbi:hypothetical protein PHYPSEUDO_009694 [Phytophthora pseudosyringae]|uniref:Uncharacterized protein n=1 Tax=Phytophthora pseudosyringae TaxID=221518 RepID=A0A8T1WC02_9STRA|nr:hypothetical protein PHYPSEUDO_009694 [Phytophthora pseudosyringae]